MPDGDAAEVQLVDGDPHVSQNVVQDTPAEEDISPEPRNSINLESFYADEVARLKAEQGLLGHKAWPVIEQAAAKKYRWSAPEKQSEAPKPDSLRDTFRKQALLLQARLEGVKDLARFRELVDYFESTVTVHEDKHVQVPKGLSADEVTKIRREWEAKGWYSDAGSVREYADEKYGILLVGREVPLRLTRENVQFIKGLISPNNDPVELAKGLVKMGFWFSEHRLGQADQMQKLSELFAAPHAQEAIELLQGLSKWSHDWFSHDGSYSSKRIELGQIEFLTQLAQSDDPQAILTPDVVKKIETLAIAFDTRITASDIQKFQEIMNNPDYIDFIAYLASLGISGSYGERMPFYENITALDEAGVLKPIVELYRSGVSIQVPDLSRSSNEPSLLKLFSSYEAVSKREEVLAGVIAHIQEILARPDTQAFLQDTEKREFVGLLADLKGIPMFIDNLSRVEETFGKDLSRRKEAIFVLRLLRDKGIGGIGGTGSTITMSLDALVMMASRESSMETFTDKNFSDFLDELRIKTGYHLVQNDLYAGDGGSSYIAGIFNNRETRQALLQDSTVAVINALHPHGSMSLNQAELYITLAESPEIVPIINALQRLNFKLLGTFDVPPHLADFEAILAIPDIVAKLESPEFQHFIEQIAQGFKVGLYMNRVPQLLELFNDEDFKRQFILPENIDFVRKIRPDREPSIVGLNRMFKTEPALRELMVQIVSKFSYYVEFIETMGSGVQEQQALFERLKTDETFRTQLFSEQTQEIFNRLKKEFGYYRLETKDAEKIITITTDFLDFLTELRVNYRYGFQMSHLANLNELYENQDSFRDVLSTLAKYGYAFNAEHLAKIAQLIPISARLPLLLDTINNATAPNEVHVVNMMDPNVDTRIIQERYVFHIEDVPFLVQLEPNIEKLPSAVDVLSQSINYKLRAAHSYHLTFVIEQGYTADQITNLKQVYEKYTNSSSIKFDIGKVEYAALLLGNEDIIARLSTFNYGFDILDVPSLKVLLSSPDKEHMLDVLDVLKSITNFEGFTFKPSLTELYFKLAQIPGIEDKLREIGTSPARDNIDSQYNLRLLISLGADVALYTHARALLSDGYFVNSRDAKNRIEQFNKSILGGTIPDNALVKIFALSGKATELDTLALKYSIAAEAAAAAQKTDWRDAMLQAENLQSAQEVLTRITISLALPVIYSDLDSESITKKQTELLALASKDKNFDETLEIACRSVGIYAKKYPKRDEKFAALMNGIRQSLELNLERNSQAYIEKRAAHSSAQFERVFNGVPEDVQARVMETWLDLSARRKLRANGDVITSEEATLTRLMRIKEIVTDDISIHLQDLFKAKIQELETAVANGEANGPKAEQLAIFKEYLMTSEGDLRQDLSAIYRSVETFIRDAQTALNNPETPQEVKAKFGKNLGTYQGMSAVLKALFKLGTISESHLKTRNDYLNQIEKFIGEFSAGLKKLKILDPERRSGDENTKALEEQVLADIKSLKGTMTEEGVSGQTVIETESTVTFRELARAPELTTSCQRLTEMTGHNQAAYSRLLDGTNEMVDIFETRNGERNRLGRSFIELSKVHLKGEEQSRLSVLIDREYVHPQYQSFSDLFSGEMILHLLDRLSTVPEVSLIFSGNRFTANKEVMAALERTGYRVREISGKYFINESNLKLEKYYDSLGGLNDVTQSSWRDFENFYIIEKIPEGEIEQAESEDLGSTPSDQAPSA